MKIIIIKSIKIVCPICLHNSMFMNTYLEHIVEDFLFSTIRETRCYNICHQLALVL